MLWNRKTLWIVPYSPLVTSKSNIKKVKKNIRRVNQRHVNDLSWNIE